MDWFFVRLWIKSTVHWSAVDPKPVKFVCELAFFPSGDQNDAKCANKQKKKKDKREKLVVFMTGYSRLVTESVSLRPGLIWLTHRVSRPFARLLCRPHVLQMRWNKLKDGFYRQNPAYFPQIYPWIHDKCSSTSFKLYLSARFSDFLILPLQCFLWCLFFYNTRKNFGQVIY